MLFTLSDAAQEHLKTSSNLQLLEFLTLGRKVKYRIFSAIGSSPVWR